MQRILDDPSEPQPGEANLAALTAGDRCALPCDPAQARPGAAGAPCGPLPSLGLSRRMGARGRLELGSGGRARA